jgi:RNA polymerase sigma-70 factor (ECF subfamily)
VKPLLVRRRLWVPIDLVAGARDGRPDPEARAAARAEQARARAALAKLPRRDRDVRLMVAVGEMKLGDVAAALGLSLPAVKMRLLRARARLAALIETDHDRTPAR